MVRLHGEKPGKDHGLDGLEPGKRRRRTIRFDDGIADARVGHTFYIRGDETHLAGPQGFEHDWFGRERAETLDFIDFVIEAKAD